MTRKDTTLAAYVLVLCLGLEARAQVSFDGSPAEGLVESLPAAQEAAPAVGPTKVAGKDSHACVPAPGQGASAIPPEIVSDASIFSLSETPDAAALERIMKSAYVSGPPSAEFHGEALRVITWNLNDARTQKAVGALLGVFQNNAKDVTSALGRGKPLDGRATEDLAKVSESDVFLLQDVPLPTAQALAEAIGAQAFWAPEYAGKDGLTGNAILSRIPLTDFRVLRFSRQAASSGKPSMAEKIADLGNEILFSADRADPRKTRLAPPYGGRLGMFARTAIGLGASGQSVWVSNSRLEDHAAPSVRCAQMGEAVAFIKTIHGPVVFGGDLNTTGSNVGIGEAAAFVKGAHTMMHPLQAPIDRQHGMAPGIQNKLHGVVDTVRLANMISHPSQASAGKVAKLGASLAVDLVPFGGTVRDGISAVKKIKNNPNPAMKMLYAGEVAANFTPWTAGAVQASKLIRLERARHDPSSKFNQEHALFRAVERDLDVKPLNPRTGFRFGMGGYQSTWSAGRSMGLADTVLDWLFLRDDSDTVQPAKAEVLSKLVDGSKSGNAAQDRLSDHYPVRVVLPIK